MKQQEMIQSLRAEIAKLQQVLDLLLEGTIEAEPVLRRGRPKGSSGKATRLNPEKLVPAKRTMSAEGKARIAAAQKKRWAAQKAAPTKRPSKTVVAKASGKATPSTAKKSARAGEGTGSTRVMQKAPPVKRAAVAAKKVVAKKVVARKNVAKKTARPVSRQPVKQVAEQAPELQTTA